MYNKELLVEVNRIKEMMGLLLEGIIDDGARKLLQSLGYSNEWIDNLAAKTVGDINFANVGDTLLGLGVRSYSDLVSKAGQTFSKNAVDVTADEIFTYLSKFAPDAVESMNKKIVALSSDAANKIIKSVKIKNLITKVDPTMVAELKSLLDAPLTGSGKKSIEELENGLSFVRNLMVNAPKGKVPDELVTLEKEFSEKIIEQGKQISSPRPTIEIPYKYTPEELAAQALAKEALEKAIERTGKNEALTKAVKDMASYKGLSPDSKKIAMTMLTDMLDSGKTQSQILEELKTAIGRMLLEDKVLAETLRKNNTWNKYIAPWISRRTAQPVNTVVWGLLLAGLTGVVGFREQLKIFFGIFQEGKKEIDKTRYQYEDNIESFQDFLGTNEGYSNEETIGTTKKLGIYYDKNGKAFKYVGDPDFIFLETGSNVPGPVVVPGGVKTMDEFKTYANGKATANGLTLSNFTEDANSFSVDASVGGQPAGSIKKKKDGSDWN